MPAGSGGGGGYRLSVSKIGIVSRKAKELMDVDACDRTSYDEIHLSDADGMALALANSMSDHLTSVIYP